MADPIIPQMTNGLRAFMEAEYLSTPYGTLRKVGDCWYDKHGKLFEVEINDSEVILRGPKLNG